MEQSMSKATSDSGKAPVSAGLGQRIRAARRDANMSQGQLAQELNTTQSAISLYEAGQRSVGIDMLYVKDSDIAELIGELEKHPEDLPELLAYWQFLRWRRANRNGRN
jgi:transcriptional regulator with XRE-family HTH domain